MNYEIQFSRITNSGKLTDRFLTCQHSVSEDLSKVSMGELFSLVEILSPWFPTAQIGKLIINNFAKYYYEGGSTSDLVNFENSLKNINEDLAKVTQEGETDWIGNLNGILAAIVESNLHLSPAGKVEAYIFRDGKVNHLTYGLAESAQVHPLSTFGNIISGELKNHDKILLTNKELFNFLSLESIKQIITLNNPSAAAVQITKLLKKFHTKNVNLLIINLISKEELANLPVENEKNETVYYLDKSVDSPWKKIGSLWHNLFVPGAKILATSVKRVGQKPSTKLPSVVQEKETIANNHKIEKALANVPEQDRFQKEFLAEERDDSLLKDEEIQYSPELYIHYYNEKNEKKEQKSSRFSYFKKTANFLIIKLKDFIHFLVQIAKDPKRRKYLYIALAILIILIIGLFITFRNRGSKIGNLQSQQILDSAITIQKEANSLLLQGSKDQAIEKYLNSIEQAKTITTNTFVGKDASNLINSSYQELDKLTSTTRFDDLKAIIKLDADAKMFFIYSGEAFFVSEQEIFKASLLGGSPSKVANLPKGKGTIASGAQKDKTIYLYTSDQNMYQFDTSTNKLEQVAISNNNRWETANSISYYSGSLYLLDGVVGQIYKHNSSQNEFSEGEEYITAQNINLKQSICLAVDGSIYVLSDSGQVTKIQKSKKQDFSLKNIPKPFAEIKKPIKIFTDADTPSIYILDLAEKRIIEFDKEGAFVKQWAFPDNFNNINDFQISFKSRKIWLLQNNNLFEIAI